MAGIGKTHVAREIVRHPLIVEHFNCIAWVSVGSKRQMEDVVMDVVAQIEGKPRSPYEGESIIDFIRIFDNILHGRRYLIVLDDVWDKDVGCFFNWLPGVGDGGRLLLTTRLQEVANCGSWNGLHQIRFLNKEDSWNLFRQNVFGERYCPLQLEKFGRKIAEKCEGLPLLILTVARILRGLDQTEDFWKAVLDEKNSVFTNAYDETYKVLYPSYEYLPQYLKACFLYMAVFPQSSVIALPKLLNLWIAEEFFEREILELEWDRGIDLAESEMEFSDPLVSELEWDRGIDSAEPVVECLEPLVLELEWDRGIDSAEFAIECLNKLVSHNVVIICKHSSRFTINIKSCKLHFAFWHLCTKEARKIHVLKRLSHPSKDDIKSQRRLSVQNNILFGIKEVYESMAATLTARSLLCTGPDHEYQVPICLNLLLLKVLDAAAIRFYEFPIQVLKLVRLKYLALTHHGKLPSSISDLQQLQYLTVRQHHSIRIVRDVDSLVPLPKEMRDEIRDLPEVRSMKLLGDSTFLAKVIWEKICDIQQVWSSQVLSNPTALKKETWMEFWRIASGEDSTQRWGMMSHIQELWSIKLLSDSSRFPTVILGQIWEKVWDMQQAWSTKLQRDSLGLLKEIWEEMWGIKEVRSTKTLSDSTFLPKEIWEMPQLRLLWIIGRNLPDPSDGTTLPNLSTLYVNAHSCTYSVFNSLPGLKKLGIKIELRSDAAETICCFKHIGLVNILQSLKCVVVNPQPVAAPGDQLSNLPRSLIKLSLSGLGYGWECMSAIGSLDWLEVLKLRCAAFQGPLWETKLFEDIDLVQWLLLESPAPNHSALLQIKGATSAYKSQNDRSS